MQPINWARVLLGGLVAGLIINIFESVLNGVVLAQRWDAAMRALGKPAIDGAEIAGFMAWGFLMGIFALWLYAELRARHGPGPSTAALAGFAVWIVGYLLASVAPMLLHLFSRRLIAVGIAVGLIEVIVGTIAGAALYRDAGAPAVRTAAAVR